MKREVPLLGIAPIAGAELELAFAQIGHPVAIDLHLIRDVCHLGRLKIQLESVGIEPF